MARIAIKQSEKLTGYRDAMPTIRDPQIYARGSAADLALEQGFDRREIVDRARQLERDNALAATLLDRGTEHVVGAGFKLKCKTGDDVWNREAEEYFAEWSKKADSRGLLSFNEILAIVFRSWLRDGDVGCVLESDGTLRVVESDEIASKQGGYTRPSDADGIELDRRGRVISYSVFDYDRSVVWQDRRRAIPRLVRIPAKDMIFLARRQRAGQTRGLSAFSGITWLLESLDQTLEAVVVAHHMAACFGLVVHKKNAFTGYMQSEDDRGVLVPELSLGPGKIMRLDPGEEAMQVNPNHPGAMFETLCDMLMRIAGARFSTPLEILNYNFTKSNYSNMRAASLECAMAAKIKQTVVLQNHFCSPVWGWVLANAIRTKQLAPRKDAGKHVWGVPESPWVDLVAELQVAMGSVDGALDTRRNLCAKRGLDWDEVIEELAEEEKKLEKLKLSAARGNLTRDAIPTTMAKVDPDAPKPEKPAASKNGTHEVNRLFSQ